MFREVTVRGHRGELVWGYRPVGWLGPWTIAKVRGAWTLSAAIVRLDLNQCAAARRDPNPTTFRFAAPRLGGFWCWPIQGDVAPNVAGRLVVTLGQPEQ
jgi:hypothetical protein